jgi:hypothetical protein
MVQHYGQPAAAGFPAGRLHGACLVRAAGGSNLKVTAGRKEKEAEKENK